MLFFLIIEVFSNHFFGGNYDKMHDHLRKFVYFPFSGPSALSLGT